MIPSRGIPPNDAVGCIRPIRGIRRFLARGSFQLTYKEINISLNCSLNPLLIPAGLRTIALKEYRGIMTTGSVPNHKTKALCVGVTHSHSLFAVDVRFGRLCGFGRSGGCCGRRGRAACGAVVGLVRRFCCLLRGGVFLVLLVVRPCFISGTSAGCLLGTRAPLTVSTHAIPTLQLLHLSSSQAAVAIAGRFGLALGCGILGGVGGLLLILLYIVFLGGGGFLLVLLGIIGLGFFLLVIVRSSVRRSRFVLRLLQISGGLVLVRCRT